MAPAVTDGIKITASEPAEACEHAAAISAQAGVRGGTMTQGGGGRCVGHLWSRERLNWEVTDSIVRLQGKCERTIILDNGDKLGEVGSI